MAKGHGLDSAQKRPCRTAVSGGLLLLSKLLASVALGPRGVASLSLILGVLALAAMSGAPKPPFASPPEGTIAGLISADDYPPESIRNNEEGTVTVRFLVDGTGSVVKCETEKSSGYAALDKRTCDIMQQRAKFTPARDKRGKGVAVNISTTVTWRLEDTPEPAQDNALRGIFTLADGKLGPCRMESERTINGQVRKQSEACPPMSEIPLLPQSARTASEYVTYRAFRIGREPESDMKPADKLLVRQFAKIAVDATGKPDCKVIETKGEQGDYAGLCADLPKLFEPMKNESGVAVPFEAYAIAEGYLRIQKDQ